jgi:2-dehydropantoate 2-reductase
MKIAVVGTGAMGSVYAGVLSRAGHEVWAIDVWEQHMGAIADGGLHVTGASGDYVVDTIKVGLHPKHAGPCDVWLLATKAADVETAAAGVAPLLRHDDVVVAFQNGLGAGERLAGQIPDRQILIAVAEGFGSTVPEPGHVHHEGMRLIRFAELHGGSSERLERLRALWDEAGFTVKTFTDAQTMIWEKFLCNVTLSAPCAAFDVTVGELMADASAWKVALGCTAEAYRLAGAMGVELGFDDPLDYVTRFAATIPNASPSMRLDHLARRPSEIDVINGQVVELSERLGLSAPYNESLCALIRHREATFGGARR